MFDYFLVYSGGCEMRRISYKEACVMYSGRENDVKMLTDPSFAGFKFNVVSGAVFFLPQDVVMG